MNINKINNTRIKRQLKQYDASPSETQIILNNVLIYICKYINIYKN